MCLYFEIVALILCSFSLSPIQAEADGQQSTHTPVSAIKGIHLMLHTLDNESFNICICFRHTLMSLQLDYEIHCMNTRLCVLLLQDTVKKEVLASVTVGVLTVVSKDAQQQGLNAVHLQSISTDIVLEGSTVMDNVRDFPPGSLPHILDCVCPSLRLPKIHGKHT